MDEDVGDHLEPALRVARTETPQGVAQRADPHTLDEDPSQVVVVNVVETEETPDRLVPCVNAVRS